MFIVIFCSLTMFINFSHLNSEYKKLQNIYNHYRTTKCKNILTNFDIHWLQALKIQVKISLIFWTGQTVWSYRRQTQDWSAIYM